MSVYAQDYGYFWNSSSNDRTYNAESFEEWLKPFFVTGVFADSLQVTAQDSPDMSVKVSPGYANLNGKPARWTSTNNLTIATASGVYNRIDTIVLRRDNTNRCVTIEVVTGTASANPQPTAPTRNSDIYELVLAQVLVNVGVTEITASKITDTRTNTDICGYVTATVEQIDFDQFKTQFDGWIADFELDMTEWSEDQQEDFADWFEAIRGQLDEDAAGHLQNEVDDTQAMIAEPYNQHVIYQEGDRCTHSGVLYKRNSWGADTPEAEAWTAAHWTAINVSDELDAEESAREAADSAISQELEGSEEGYAIVIDGDIAPKAIAKGKYLFIKNHSTLAMGGYHAKTAIALGATVSSSNVEADSDGIANAINEQMANYVSSRIKAKSFSYSNQNFTANTLKLVAYGSNMGFTSNDTIIGAVLTSCADGTNASAGSFSVRSSDHLFDLGFASSSTISNATIKGYILYI